MDDDFHSLNKGVFVIPFDPARGTATSGAGPSKPRPLQPIYDESLSRFEDEYERYESTRTAEQFGEVDDWLERCDAPPTIKQAFPIRRLPLALVQNISPSFVRALPAARGRPATINGRDMGDLAAATRAVAVAYLGEAALAAKKAGRTPIDEVERWWSGLDDGRPLLVHVQQAQLIPSAVLAELIYILTLHHSVPFRLLLSVPSISIFMSKWTLLEPSEVDLSILSSGRARKRSAAVHAILAAAGDAAAMPVAVASEVADELRRDEELFGGGAAGALKALKWLLLRHSFTSPLNEATSDELECASLEDLLPLVERMKEDESGSKEFTVGATSDLVSVHNPAPRMSILQALARPDIFAAGRGYEATAAASREAGGETEEDTSTPRQTRRGAATTDNVAMPSRTATLTRNTTSSPTTPRAVANGHAAGGVVSVPGAAEEAPRPFKEIEALYSMWQSAGKKINLWDWLEGFRDAVTHEDRAGANGAPDQNGGTDVERETTPTPSTPKRGKRKRGEVEEDDEEHARAEETREVDEEEDARLHATFIRFVEESRMLGLVRGRGRGAGRRADEVAKGVLMV